jgi:hypothetical protein
MKTELLGSKRARRMMERLGEIDKLEVIEVP